MTALASPAKNRAGALVSAMVPGYLCHPCSDQGPMRRWGRLMPPMGARTSGGGGTGDSRRASVHCRLLQTALASAGGSNGLILTKRYFQALAHHEEIMAATGGTAT